MTDIGVPSREISRETSVSRRISRQNTFRLLSVEVAEERSHGSDDNDDHVDNCNDEAIDHLLNGNIGGTVHYEGDLRAGVVAASVGGAAALPRGMTRSDSGRRRSLSRNSSMSSIGSFDGPMREIVVVPDEDEFAFLAEMGRRTRRCSDVTTDSTLDFQPGEKQHDEISDDGPADCEIVQLKMGPRRRDDSLDGLKGSFLSNCSTVVHGNLNRDKSNSHCDDENCDVNSALPDAISVDSDNSNTLSLLASKLDAVGFDGDTRNESLNSDYIRGGLHDSASLTRMKLSCKSKSAELQQKARLDSIDFNGESESDSLNSYRLRAGFHDSTSLAKAKFSHKCKGSLSVQHVRFDSIDLDGESESESLNSHRLRAGFHDSTSLAKAKFFRKCSSGIYDSTNTATTATSTVLSDFLAVTDDSFSSMESSPYDAIFSGRKSQDVSKSKISKLELASRFYDCDDDTLNDIASTDSESLNTVDFHLNNYGTAAR